jgi:uncharacterized membrane protein HdeD (DUF308 family)
METSTYGRLDRTSRANFGHFSWLLIPWGVVAIIAGVAAIVWPGLTLVTLTFIFGAFAVVTGVIELWHAVASAGSGEMRALLAIRGVITIALGLLAIFLPAVTIGAFVLILAAYLFVLGIVEVITAFRCHVSGALLVRGLLAIAFGVVALIWPGLAAVSLALVFGIYAILAGLTAILVGMRIARAA